MLLPLLSPRYLHLATAIAPVVGGGAVMFWRFQETQRPVSIPKIVIPPLGMSTGFGMFFVPALRVPFSWAITAFLAGALLLSIPLQHTSKLHVEGEHIMMRRSRAFLLILLGLFALRIALHDYIGHLISPAQTGAVFFLMAFGMILRWRLAMLFEYRALRATMAA